MAAPLFVFQSMKPIDIQIIGEEMAIKWDNDEESFIRLAKLTGGSVTQTQTDGIRLIGTHPIADSKRVFPKRLKRFRPIASAMNVGAVREMNSVAQSHDAWLKFKRLPARKNAGFGS